MICSPHYLLKGIEGMAVIHVKHVIYIHIHYSNDTPIYSHIYSNNIVIYAYLYTLETKRPSCRISSDNIWALHASNYWVKYAKKNPIQVQKLANDKNKASQVYDNFAH
jgi:hypothetical protein